MRNRRNSSKSIKDRPEEQGKKDPMATGPNARSQGNRPRQTYEDEIRKALVLGKEWKEIDQGIPMQRHWK